MQTDSSKSAFLTPTQCEAILQDALELLEHCGIEVPPDPLRLLERLTGLGHASRNGRVFLQRGEVLEYLSYLRALPSAPAMPEHPPLTGMVSIYSGHWTDLQGNTASFSTDALIACARFCQACGEAYGFAANVPGYARDVPAELESLHKYMVSARHCEQAVAEPSSRLSARYLFDMAEVMGDPILRLPAFPPSPLTLAGSSVQAVVEHGSRLKSAYVYSMSLLGVTTPLSVGQGFAVNVAEVLGCALLLHRLTDLPVEIRPNLIPFDLRSLNLAFGAPEKWLLERMAADLYAYLMRRPTDYRSTNIHTHAKVPGAQAASEKGSLMAAGVAHGASRFYCIGTLALDELFSPVQLVWDLEMMAQLERGRRGLVPDAPIADLAQYVEQHRKTGFLATDRTLDHYEEIIGPASIFDRNSMGAWMKGQSADALEKARDQAAALWDREPSYLLPEDKSRELQRIYDRASNDL